MIDHLLVQCHNHPQSHLIVINPNKDIKKKTEKIIKETYPVLNQDHHPTVKVLKAPEVLHQDLLSKKERKNKRNKENKGKRKMLIKINQRKNNHATKKENQVDQRIKKIKRTPKELLLPYHPHLIPNHNLFKSRKIINENTFIEIKNVKMIKKTKEIHTHVNINVKMRKNTIEIIEMIDNISIEMISGMKKHIIMKNLKKIMVITREKETKRVKKFQAEDQTVPCLRGQDQTVLLVRTEGFPTLNHEFLLRTKNVLIDH